MLARVARGDPSIARRARKEDEMRIEIRISVALFASIAIPGCVAWVEPGAGEEALSSASCDCRRAIYPDGSTYCEIVSCPAMGACPVAMPVPPARPLREPPSLP